MESKRVVRGEILLPEEVSPGTADLVVMVEDVSRADAPSIVVGEQRQPRTGLRSGEVLPFEVEIPGDQIDQRHVYSVRVHVDRSGSGEIEKGDLVSTQSCPVLTRGHGDVARVKVSRV